MEIGSTGRDRGSREMREDDFYRTTWYLVSGWGGGGQEEQGYARQPFLHFARQNFQRPRLRHSVHQAYPM
eukprot:767594-Hanusia_phi.AAC.22